MFEFFVNYNLNFSNHLGFRLCDSCINQLLLIVHEIYQLFDDSLEIRSIFLDIS